MPMLNGIKVACGPCIRGHRSTKCSHTSERVMLLVRKPGRPLSACPHPRDVQCNCSSITVAIPMKADCPCPSEASKSGKEQTAKGSCCTPSANTPVTDLPSPTRNEYRVTKNISRPESSKKQSYDPSNFARMSLDTMNVVTPPQSGSVDFGNGFAPPNMYTPSPTGFTPPSNGFAPPQNGYAQPYPIPPPGYVAVPNGFVHTPYPTTPMGSAAPATGFEQQIDPSFFNAGSLYPAQYNNFGDMSSGPQTYQPMSAPSNGFVPDKFHPYDGMAHMDTNMVPMNDMKNEVPRALANHGRLNGDEGRAFEEVFASQPDGPSPASASETSEPPELKSCCAPKTAPKALKEEPATPANIDSHAQSDMQKSYSHNTIAPAYLDMQANLQNQQPLSFLINQHQQQFPSTAALPYGSFENPAQPSTWRQNMQLNHTSGAQNTGAPSSSVVPLAQDHICCCGDTCSCVGCVSHPFNKTIYDYAQNAFPAQENGTYDGAQGVANDNTNVLDSQGTDPLSSPALTPTSAGGNGDDLNLNTSNYFWVKLPVNGPCQGLEGMCNCGPGCECVGCEMHDPKRIGQ